MVHARLIVGGTKESRQSKATEQSDVPPARYSLVTELCRSGVTESKVTELCPVTAENGRATIGINQIRGLQRYLSLKRGLKTKLAIIPEAQRMTTEAQNALLKTLEEPPANSILVLTAPHPGLLLPTVVSRCQLLNLKPAIDLDLKSEAHQKAAKDFLRLLRQGRGERFSWVESNLEIIKPQALSLKLLDVWISVLRDLLLIRGGCKEAVLNKELLQIVRDRSKIEIGGFQDGLEKIVQTKTILAATNTSPRLALEVLLLDLPKVE